MLPLNLLFFVFTHSSNNTIKTPYISKENSLSLVCYWFIRSSKLSISSVFVNIFGVYLTTLMKKFIKVHSFKNQIEFQIAVLSNIYGHNNIKISILIWAAMIDLVLIFEFCKL